MAALYGATGQYEYTTATGGAKEILKDWYIDDVRKVFYKASPLMDRLEKRVPKQIIGGNHAVISLQYGFDPGTGGVSEGGTMPQPGQISRDQCQVPIKELAHTIALTTKIIAVAKSNKGAFVNVLTDKIKQATTAFKYQCDRMLWGDGSGYLCTVATCDSGGTSAAANVTVTNKEDLRYLFEGMHVQVVDTDTTTLNSGTNYPAVVSKVSPSGKSFTMTMRSGNWGAQVAAGDFVLAAWPGLSTRTYDPSGSANTFYEMMGLKGIINNADPTTGDLQGLDSATYAAWNAAVETASSNRDLTEGLMIDAYNAVIQNGGEATAIYGDMKMQKAFALTQTPDRRHVNTNEFTGGWSALMFQCGGKPIPFFGWKQAVPETIYFVDESHLFFVHTGDVDWIPGTEGVMHWDAGYAQKIGALEWFVNLATDHRGAFCKLDKINAN